MNDDDITKIFRRFLESACTIWPTLIFQGLVWAGVLIFLFKGFHSGLERLLEDIGTPDIPHWMFIPVGVGIQMTVHLIRKKPLLRDTNREQLEVLEHIVNQLPENERNPVWRRIANKMCDQFAFDSSSPKKLTEVAKDAIREEREENAAVVAPVKTTT